MLGKGALLIIGKQLGQPDVCMPGDDMFEQLEHDVDEPADVFEYVRLYWTFRIKVNLSIRSLTIFI